MPRFQDLKLESFGIGVLCGLVLEGVETLDDENQRNLNQSFLAAFKVVEQNFAREHLRFALILDRMHGTSPDVEAIMLWWLHTWATKDAPGTTWRFTMPATIAEDYLEHHLPGGREMWIEAARAFMDEYREAHA